MTRACFLAEAEWPRLFHKFGFRTPPEPMLRRGFLFPTPSKLQSWKQRRFIFEFQVVKTRIPSISKARVVCSPGSQLSVVKRADPSHKWLPDWAVDSGYRHVPWRRPREGCCDAGSGSFLLQGSGFARREPFRS